MGDKNKDKVYINIDPDSLNIDNRIPEGAIIIAPKKKKPKPRLGPQAPKAGRPKGGWTA